MSPKRTEKVSKASEMARQALGRDGDWPGAPRSRRLEPSAVFVPAGDSEPVLTLGRLREHLV